MEPPHSPARIMLLRRQVAPKVRERDHENLTRLGHRRCGDGPRSRVCECNGQRQRRRSPHDHGTVERGARRVLEALAPSSPPLLVASSPPLVPLVVGLAKVRRLTRRTHQCLCPVRRLVCQPWQLALHLGSQTGIQCACGILPGHSQRPDDQQVFIPSGGTCLRIVCLNGRCTLEKTLL